MRRSTGSRPTRPATTFGQVLGVVVQTRRRSKEAMQAAVAGELGITQGTYSRLEAGRSLFDTAQLRKAAKALGVTATQIVETAERCADDLVERGVDVLDDPAASLAESGRLWVAPDVIRATVEDVDSRAEQARIMARLKSAKTMQRVHAHVRVAD